MITKKKIFLILLVVFFTASFFSCKTANDSIFQTNKKPDVSAVEYFKKFNSNNIDLKKIFFVKSPEVSSITFKYQFLKTFHNNLEYLYFGSGYLKEKTFFFKSINNREYGCNEVLMSLSKEDEFPFSEDNNVKNLFEEYQFYNFLNKKFAFGQKKTIILIYNFATGNLFFKDVKRILDFVEKNNDYDYVILSTNFYDFNSKKFLP